MRSSTSGDLEAPPSRDRRLARTLMVRLTLRIRTVPGETPPLTTALHSLMLEARADYACGACSLSTALGTCAIITYVEEWQTESALRAQVRSIRFTRLLALAEHATDTPLVQFQLDDRTRGLDYVEEVRRDLLTST